MPAPALDDPNAVLAMDLAATILSDGRSSRLYQNIKERKGLVNTISAGFATHLYPGMVYAIATPASATPEQIVQETWQEMKNLATLPPSEAEMAKARRVIRNGLLFGMETNTGQSSTIGYYYTLTGSMDFLNQYLQRLDAITPEDVAAVAATYFSSEPVTVIIKPDTASAHGSDQ